MCSKDLELVLGKALEIEAGKTYVLQSTGADLPKEYITKALEGLTETTGAKFIYLSSRVQIARETDGDL
jgi:hypothetical protein